MFAAEKKQYELEGIDPFYPSFLRKRRDGACARLPGLWQDREVDDSIGHPRLWTWLWSFIKYCLMIRMVFGE